MELSETETACVEERLRSFKLYDRYVDVVSIFEMLFTVSHTSIPSTVVHFERFPTVSSGGVHVTPDFTVLFDDNTAIIGEIARFARREESVDALCDQLLRYDKLGQVPGKDGRPVPVQSIDTLLLVPLELGNPATSRILDERMLNGDHAFSPQKPPVIAQFGFDADKYTIQHLAHPDNGRVNDGQRELGLGRIFQESLNCRPERFEDIKSARSFMNDEVDSLYLATHLWAKTFPTEVPSGEFERPVRIKVDPAELAERLRRQHGAVKASDIRRALGLLADAQLARKESGEWVVAWEELRSARRRDLAVSLAELACRRPQSGAVQRLPKPPAIAETEELRLF